MLPGSKEGEVDSARKFWQTETWDYFCNLFWIVVAVAVGVAFVAGFLVIAYARATNKSGAHDPVP
jgi:ABC-type Fe3+ transport system permease subunit